MKSLLIVRGFMLIFLKIIVACLVYFVIIFCFYLFCSSMGSPLFLFLFLDPLFPYGFNLCLLIWVYIRGLTEVQVWGTGHSRRDRVLNGNSKVSSWRRMSSAKQGPNVIPQNQILPLRWKFKWIRLKHPVMLTILNHECWMRFCLRNQCQKPKMAHCY